MFHPSLPTDAMQELYPRAVYPSGSETGGTYGRT
jgi:hypothetical protein